MAGVAGPMLRDSRARGAHFLSGLLVGGLAGSTLVSLVVQRLGRLLAVIPLTDRRLVAVVTMCGFGVADMLNRTPHVWRQVPQRFVRRFPPVRLGLIWGFDLSLLITTQKSTSLAWGALTALVLLDPSAAVPVVLTMTVLGVAAIAARSVRWSFVGPAWRGDRDQAWFRPMRQLAGGLLMVVGISLVFGLM